MRKCIDLSEREEEVIRLLADGKTLKDIARLHNLSEKTIDSQKTGAMHKLAIHCRAELVHFCIATGRIQLKFKSTGERL